MQQDGTANLMGSLLGKDAQQYKFGQYRLDVMAQLSFLVPNRNHLTLLQKMVTSHIHRNNAALMIVYCLTIGRACGESVFIERVG